MQGNEGCGGLEAGELRTVWVPDAAQEAIRDLVGVFGCSAFICAWHANHPRGFLLRQGWHHRRAGVDQAPPPATDWSAL
jgi:hypothetical protein